MLFSNPAKKLFLLAGLVVGLRVFALDLPFMEPYNSLSRQIIVASVARNFYQDGFDFLRPEIDNNGAGPYLYNAEMPFYSYAMAWMYKLSGGTDPWAARSVSVAASLILLWSLYHLIRLKSDPSAAFWGTLFAGISPLALALSRALQPDVHMVAFGVASVTALSFFYENKRSYFFWLSALCMFFAVSSKIYALHFGLPLIYIALRNEGKKIFFDPKYYIYAAAVALSLIWYAWMWYAGQSLELRYKPYAYHSLRGPAGMAYWQFFSPGYLWIYFKTLIFHLLTPIGFACLCLSGRRPRQSGDHLFEVWTLAALIYTFVLWKFIIAHSYYQLVYLPILSWCVGCGAARVQNYLRTRNGWVKAAAAVFAAAFFALSVSRFYPGIYRIPASYDAVLAAGDRAQALLPKQALVIASFGPTPLLLYYCDRKGWSFPIDNPDDRALIEEMQLLRDKGAAYFVTSDPHSLSSRPQLMNYLLKNSDVLEESSRHLIARWHD